MLRERSSVYEKIDASAKGYVIPLVVLVVIAALAAGKIPVRFPEKTAPTAAIDFLRANPVQGNMFNNDEIGDYVIYWLYPRYKVFMDGRSDMYGEPILKEYLKVVHIEPGWKDVLDKVRHQLHLLLHRLRTGTASFDGCWLEAASTSDNVASIFLRNTPENAEAIARYPPAARFRKGALRRGMECGASRGLAQ